MKRRKGIRGVLVATATPGGAYTIKTKGGDKPTSFRCSKTIHRANRK